MVKICDVKGFHEYTPWRTLEVKRQDGTMTGMSYTTAISDFYVRNCKCCNKLDSAPNAVVMGIKTRQGGKIKKMNLAI